jgi:hypothetical protein
MIFVIHILQDNDEIEVINILIYIDFLIIFAALFKMFSNTGYYEETLTLFYFTCFRNGSRIPEPDPFL